MKVLEISKLDTRRKPIITIDDNLDKYCDVAPFQEKVDIANHMLKTNNFFDKMSLKESIMKP
ncbi:MAG TPA: hypothetical protein PKD51_04470 [Saprospiraceae bacterium]|nr:hypothetical protein [Saprospiraceae bacterium]